MTKCFQNLVLNFSPVKLSKSKTLPPNFLNVPLSLSNPDHVTLIHDYQLPLTNHPIFYQDKKWTSGKTDLYF